MENIIFEILPTPEKWSDEKIQKWCIDVCALLRRENLLTINLPEVVEEERGGERNVGYTPKLDNLHFSGLLKQHLHGLITIPNKICVRMPKAEFEKWVAHAYERGIRHLILVGGERDIEYPGYTVMEATRFVRRHYPDVKIGGIAIFTRKNEARRLMDKMQAGMEFFISQIIFESANMKQIVHNLARLCQEEGRAMPRLYLSLALAARTRDIEFMKWLGVEFPTAVHAFLIESGEEKVEEGSLEVVDTMLEDIFHFMEKERVDLGFNIEHVMHTNLHLSEKLFKNIKKRMAQ
ncbi:MAG: methylenetetrahydrofolate reductase [Parachlamydia sp.]|nr:methylenetetrahydrofolate reductase [Parachlamydia sp.]